MAGPFIDKWLEIVVSGKFLTEGFTNTFGYKYSGASPPSGSDLNGLALDFWNNIVAAKIAPCMSTGVTLNSVTVRDRSNVSGAEGGFTPSTPITGGRNNPPDQNSTAMVVSQRSARVGRSGRGRSFIGGIPQADAQGDVLDVAIGTLGIVLGSALRTYVGTLPVPVQAVIASRKLVQLLPIITDIVTNQIDVQTRRLPGHRRHRRHHTIP